MDRYWYDANEKIAQDPRCRVCKGTDIQRAHIVPRRYDRKEWFGPDGLVDTSEFLDLSDFQGLKQMLYVDPRSIVPLCVKHHTEFDQSKLELLPYLERDEEGYAASVLGLVGAMGRMTIGDINDTVYEALAHLHERGIAVQEKSLSPPRTPTTVSFAAALQKSAKVLGSEH